ncbi:putative phosphopantothenoylcysteine decarboxylase [Zea mays]|jgi:hypothetical protein|uniref:Putative phosphopantothenoylcysteine decarboxylase n=1 Tax=Zea mays TaxID=4577 RepID=A0A1D6NSY0_MAIZE|nr:putative phosphopantothenoylcysteine decarboxylase [Zea mays]
MDDWRRQRQTDDMDMYLHLLTTLHSFLTWLSLQIDVVRQSAIVGLDFSASRKKEKKRGAIN